MAQKRKYEALEQDEFPILPLSVGYSAYNDDNGAIQMGTATGYLVRRSIIPKRLFAPFMKSNDSNLRDMAFALFDKYGNWEPKFKTSYDPAFGSNVWNNESDEEDILFISTVRVPDPTYRSEGIGKLLVGRLIKKALKISNQFITITRPADPQPSKNTAPDPTIRFFRSYGFRRIGSSHYFAFSRLRDHHSRRRPADKDFDTPKTTQASLDLSVLMVVNSDSISDFESGRALVSLLRKKPIAADAWRAVDSDGNNALHLASLAGKPLCTAWLMGRCGELLNHRNDNNELADEALDSHLSGLRKASPDRFTGHSHDHITCSALLYGTKWYTPNDFIMVAGGCTCGHCNSGILPLRMAHALRTAALKILQVLNAPTSDSPGRKTNFPAWCLKDHPFLKYLTAATKKTMKVAANRRGFTAIALRIQDELMRSVLPSASHVKTLVEEHGHSTEFLASGGTVDAVMNLIFRVATDRDEFLGDGSFMEESSVIVNNWPVCRNDDEWKNALFRMGYDCRVQV